MSKAIGDVLREVVQKYRLQGELDKARLPEIWKQVVGSAIARRSSVTGFAEGTLFVRVHDSVWRSEIHLRREELRTQLNASIGREMIVEIVLR